MTQWQDIGASDEFVENEPAAINVGGTSVAVFRLGDEVFALHDLCTHGNARLSDGYVEDGCVECPLHQGLFDIRNGAPRCAPVTEAVRSFPVRVVAGRVEVAVNNSPSTMGAEAQPHTVQQYKGVVLAIERAAADVAIIKIMTDDLIPPVPYQAGQYIDILLSEGQRRSYSMASAQGSRVLDLHIRHMPGGLFTDRVFTSLGVGDWLDLEGPHGRFFLRASTAPVILLASGTGFAPIKAIVEAAIEHGNTRSMILYWGGRRPADIYLHQLCEQWSKAFAWFQFTPVLSDAMPDDHWTGRQGFVHQAVMQDHPDLSQHEVYACGAPAMIDAAKRDFVELCRLKPDAFFADAFVSKADSKGSNKLDIAEYSVVS